MRLLDFLIDRLLDRFFSRLDERAIARSKMAELDCRVKFDGLHSVMV